MASIWDLLPAALWPVQPIAWPPDPMQPSRPQETAPSQASATAVPAFGWAPPAAASTPAFGWAAAPRAPANAPAYSGAIDPNAFLGSYPDVATLDPARTVRLLEDARRAHAFASWWFGPPSVRPAQQMRYATATAGAPRPSGPAAGIDEAADALSPLAAMEAAAAPPTNRSDRSDATIGNSDTRANADAAAQRLVPEAATGDPNIERQGKLGGLQAIQQKEDQWTPELRAQYCALDPATIAADFGNKLQGSLGQIDPLTNQPITQEWIKRQTAQMQQTVEQIQKQLGCPSETY